MAGDQSSGDAERNTGGGGVTPRILRCLWSLTSCSSEPRWNQRMAGAEMSFCCMLGHKTLPYSLCNKNCFQGLLWICAVILMSWFCAMKCRYSISLRDNVLISIVTAALWDPSSFNSGRMSGFVDSFVKRVLPSLSLYLWRWMHTHVIRCVWE